MLLQEDAVPAKSGKKKKKDDKEAKGKKKAGKDKGPASEADEEEEEEEEEGREEKKPKGREWNFGAGPRPGITGPPRPLSDSLRPLTSPPPSSAGTRYMHQGKALNMDGRSCTGPCWTRNIRAALMVTCVMPAIPGLEHTALSCLLSISATIDRLSSPGTLWKTLDDLHLRELLWLDRLDILLTALSGDSALLDPLLDAFPPN